MRTLASTVLAEVDQPWHYSNPVYEAQRQNAVRDIPTLGHLARLVGSVCGLTSVPAPSDAVAATIAFWYDFGAPSTVFVGEADAERECGTAVGGVAIGHPIRRPQFRPLLARNRHGMDVAQSGDARAVEPSGVPNACAREDFTRDGRRLRCAVGDGGLTSDPVSR